MIRNITEKDSSLIKQIIGIDINERNDINYSVSGISFNDDGVVDSIILFGTRSITDYFGGNLPNNDYMDDSEGSTEIIGYYTADGTDEDMHKTLYPFARKLGYMSQMWYIPKDEEDCNRARKCMDMSKCKYHNILVKCIRFL